jgi:hypothetical protein
MKYVPRLTGRAVSCLLAVVLVNSLAVANAETQSGQVLVQAVHGSATYSVSGGQALPVKENLVLNRGATIKTAPDAKVDLILQYNGTVLRLMPGSTLKFDKLNQETAAEGAITETSLNLVAGSIIGSQRKLATPSTFQVNIPGGVATIKGTEYVVRADGAVSVLSGSVQVNYNLPGNGGSVKVTVTAGNSFNPATGKVVQTTPEFLDPAHTIADIDTVRQNAKVFKTGGATVVVKPQSVLSPTKGNNGVGNGEDGQPPGNPPVNDGQGTGPGNPGNRHHGKTKIKSS